MNYQGGQRNDERTIENDNLDDEPFIEFLKNAIQAADSVMDEGAAYYIWHANSRAKCFYEALEENGWPIKQELIWNKNTLVLGRQDYQWKHEPCIYGWKEGAAHYFINVRSLTTVLEHKNIEDITPDEALEMIKEMSEFTTVQDFKKPSKSPEHPTMKPVELFARLIRNSSRPGENVLDLFGGSGTTIIACENLKRNAYVMEYEPAYCDVIIKRWEDYTGQKAELIN